MRKASTRLPEQGTQTPSPAPDLIPAETKKSTESSLCDWYSKRGHFITKCMPEMALSNDACAVIIPYMAISNEITITVSLLLKS